MRAWRAGRWSAVRLEAISRRGISGSRTHCQRQSVADYLHQNANIEDASVQGWVRSVRKQKRIAFAVVSDGSTIDSLQAVLKPEHAAHLSTGTAVRMTGDWRASQGSKQSHELQVSSLEVLGENDAEGNPLQPKYQSQEFLRTIPHLRARLPANALLLRLRSQLIASLTNFFAEQDFVQCHTPIITSSDCEGAGEVFTVSSNESKDSTQASKPGKDGQAEHFFRSPKYLTVSGQLHLEALSQAVDKVWTLSPTFRAEKSDTPRHLSEFYMLEAEMCFTQSLDDILDLVENMLRSSVTALKSSRTYNELLKLRHASSNGEQGAEDKLVSAEIIQQRWSGITAPSWPRITYEDALGTLQTAQDKGTANFEHPPTWDTGLQAEHERYLATHIGQGSPVFVTHYPRAQKPFYMSPSPSGADTAACFDLLVPDLCELAGGSLREHNLTSLQSTMREKGVKGEGLEWYQDLRRYGSVPHGGFGLGFDRLVGYLGGVGSIRDVVAFPRWAARCEC